MIPSFLYIFIEKWYKYIYVQKVEIWHYCCIVSAFYHIDVMFRRR
jgi:hypothetical protein